ncbi:hypothetical protein [Sulfitobacter sp. MF3-043]|uniref:hypothetical protein n=1 Tax=Sulfitobacter sediminivivens TaxID=3252902 RepID=UPI0036DEE54B
MPSHDNKSRGYFRTLHSALLKQLRPIRAEELALKRKKPRTAAEEARLEEVIAKRREVAKNIIILADTEDAYLRSAKGTAAALRDLKAARDTAAKTTRNLNTINEALVTVALMTQIITDLARIFGV